MLTDNPYPDPGQAFEAQELREALVRAVALKLHPTYAEIITLRYGLAGGRTMTLDEVSFECGISRERVRVLDKMALGVLWRDNSLREIAENRWYDPTRRWKGYHYVNRP